MQNGGRSLLKCAFKEQQDELLPTEKKSNFLIQLIEEGFFDMVEFSRDLIIEEDPQLW